MALTIIFNLVSYGKRFNCNFPKPWLSTCKVCDSNLLESIAYLDNVYLQKLSFFSSTSIDTDTDEFFTFSNLSCKKTHNTLVIIRRILITHKIYICSYYVGLCQICNN